jgi:glycosyltransferase involved in cell wall biosynthesis
VRIGIDYHPATTHAPGTGRYARELVRALASLEGRPELWLAELGGARATIGEPALGLEGRWGVHRRRVPLPRRLLTALEPLGLGPGRLVGPVDLFQRTRPAWPRRLSMPAVRAIAELPTPGAPEEDRVRAELGLDDAWIVFSEQGRLELVERFGLPADRVYRTPVGADHWVRELEPGALDAPTNTGPQRLVVLGALSRSRHPERILDAFDALRSMRADVELVFVGGPGDAAEALTRRLSFASSRSAVRWIPPVESELPRLVAGASALVHRSEGELTPVTPLEAFAAGVPAVVSDSPVFREALGDEATYVPTPLSRRHRLEFPDQLAAALDSALDPGARARRRRLAAPFTWTACARVTIGRWREVLGLDAPSVA